MKRFEDVVDFHGHSCPGLALGYRVSLRALRELGKRAEDEEMVAIVENSSCAVDAVQAMTGCTFGKGNLIFRDFGKQVYTFLRRPSGAGFRIVIDWKRPEETPREKLLWERFRKGDRSAQVTRFVRDRKETKIKAVLDADDTSLMTVQKVKLALPAEAEIFPSFSCESCSEKVMESRLRVRDGKMICIPCFERNT